MLSPGSQAHTSATENVPWIGAIFLSFLSHFCYSLESLQEYALAGAWVFCKLYFSAPLNLLCLGPLERACVSKCPVWTRVSLQITHQPSSVTQVPREVTGGIYLPNLSATI